MAGIVAIKNTDGTIRCSYVRDNLEKAGDTLYKYYLNSQRVNKLLDFGTIERLRPYLNSRMANSVETYCYYDDGELIYDKTNFYFNSMSDFMDYIYRDFFTKHTGDDKVFFFDSETNCWFQACCSSRKFIPYLDCVLHKDISTVEEMQEYYNFLEKLVPPEALIEYRNTRNTNNFNYREFVNKFGEKIYDLTFSLCCLEKDISDAKKNGGVHNDWKPWKRSLKDFYEWRLELLSSSSQEPEFLDLMNDFMGKMSKIELEEFYGRICGLLKGRSRKPEFMDLVMDQMGKMSSDELEEFIFKNGLLDSSFNQENNKSK